MLAMEQKQASWNQSVPRGPLVFVNSLIDASRLQGSTCLRNHWEGEGEFFFEVVRGPTRNRGEVQIANFHAKPQY